MDQYKIVIDENSNIDLISIVDSPAIETLFIALNENVVEEIKLSSIEQRIIMGPVLVPNKKIVRLDDNKNKFTIEFDEDTIKKYAYNFINQSNVNLTNINHKASSVLSRKEVSLSESWIKTSEYDKSNEYYDLPLGTWFVTMKVHNDKIWDKIKKGELRGFSIEAMVNLQKINLSKNKGFYDYMKIFMK
jgi:hypothetical protein